MIYIFILIKKAVILPLFLGPPENSEIGQILDAVKIDVY
jgi:hypothetical protein